ncbi:MAG TPA: GtrA family protein [Acidimicrobiales bacterium]|nr:GtrA family protein [Acidimicrobiales bacterium]
MRYTPKRLWQLYQTPTGGKMMRYTAVSVISTVVSFTVLSIVFGALRLWSEVPDVFVANVVAGLCSYNLNRRWVWGRTGRSHLVKEVIPFWAMSLTGMAWSLLAAAEAHHLAIAHHLHHLVRTVLVLGANVGAWGSLWVIKFLVFNRVFGGKAKRAVPELVNLG